MTQITLEIQDELAKEAQKMSDLNLLVEDAIRLHQKQAETVDHSMGPRAFVRKWLGAFAGKPESEDPRLAYLEKKYLS